MQQLVTQFPTEPLYCNRLATLLQSRGRGADAIACYRNLLAARPNLANSRYNLARLLKREGHMQQALEEYEQCLADKIENPEEVLSNIAVIHTELHQHDEARKLLKAALVSKPRYIPALFNLALLLEEEGDWDEAREAYRRILQLQPGHSGALAHIANGEHITNPADQLVLEMLEVVGREELPPEEKESLLYALGKTQDDSGEYGHAFDYYQQANALSSARCGSYNRAAQEKQIDQLIEACDSSWLKAIEPVSNAPLVFICGMFRSGTTLLEQILSTHPALTAGGEMNFFQRAIRPFPEGILTADPAQLHAVGQAYTDYLAQHFSMDARVINKRPDNTLCLGLIKALFPEARVITTHRQPLDNAISLFFQPLEAAQPYANTLLDVGHYYLQNQRLLEHWRSLLGDSLLEVRYESLLENPKEAITEALSHLQLDWHEDCLTFYKTRNRVRTASVHQVRRPLYGSSSGRWQNYTAEVQALRSFLEENSVGKGG